MQPFAPTAVVIGAGPAGLTAAWELMDRTNVHPVVIEQDPHVGGLSRTAVFKGNRIDLGGHRFFSKSDRVMAWWQNLLPPQGAPARDDRLLGRDVPPVGQIWHRGIGEREVFPVKPPDPELEDCVLLVRQRLSRIRFIGKFFDYPLALNAATLARLGPLRTARIAASYARAAVLPVRPERSLEDFLVNRFGRELYRSFFKDYTEKVWGVPCERIKPEWGAQRIKGLNIRNAVGHAVRRLFHRDHSVGQKETETSLIGRFFYPKFGPGQLWEEAARDVSDHGGEVRLGHRAVGLLLSGNRVTEVRVEETATGRRYTIPADYVISTMPVRDLVRGMEGRDVPEPVRRTADGLLYRDFFTVGLLLKKLKVRNKTRIPTVNGIIPDNWIYVQEPQVTMGRIQVFNNWSPYLVKDPETVWLGLEYFATEGDALWRRNDDELKQLAVDELARIGFADPVDVLDGTVIRALKAYPAYFGSYDDFGQVRGFLDGIENLFLIGRNGMHRYNNQDHSMLTAMAAVDAIQSGSTAKDALWDVNAEADYHEEKAGTGGDRSRT